MKLSPRTKILLAAVAVVAAHAREWHPPAPGELALKLLGAALTAIVVAVKLLGPVQA